MARLGAKVSRSEVSSILKNTFIGWNFFMKPAPYLFSGPNWLCGAFGGKIVPEENFAQFCPSRISFFKKHVFWWNSLTKLVPYLFSWPNSLYGAFGGKIVPNEIFTQFCLKSPLKFVFPKNTFSVWIFVLNRTTPIFMAKRTWWHDWGQKWPGANFRPSKKTRFRMEFFDETGPIPLFWA